MVNQNQIRDDWSYVCSTTEDFEKLLVKVAKDHNYLPGCFFLAQRLNNEFDYFEAAYHPTAKTDITINTFKNYKERRDELYQKFYEILSLLSKKEIVSLINEDLERLLKVYQSQQSEKRSIADHMVEHLETRDKIKILYEEMSFWMGRWVQLDVTQKKYQVCQDKYCTIIHKLDEELKNYINQEGKENFTYLIDEAKKRLILKPDGSTRFDFWWWYYSAEK